MTFVFVSGCILSITLLVSLWLKEPRETRAPTLLDGSRLDAALRRVEGMESYVTSRRYNLNKEFSRL